MRVNTDLEEYLHFSEGQPHTSVLASPWSQATYVDCTDDIYHPLGRSLIIFVAKLLINFVINQKLIRFFDDLEKILLISFIVSDDAHSEDHNGSE